MVHLKVFAIAAAIGLTAYGGVLLLIALFRVLGLQEWSCATGQSRPRRSLPAPPATCVSYL